MTTVTGTAIPDNIVAKLRKVMALQTSPNEHEAAVALATLTRLLSEYNLSVADLEAKGKEAAKIGEGGAPDLGKAAFQWKLNLARTIARHYYCASIIDQRQSNQSRVRFVGRPENVESLGMLYNWVVDQIKRISADARREHHASTGEHIDPLRWQLSFGLGIVARLGDRLEDMRKREADAATTALAVHHDAEVSDYLEAKYGYRTDGQKTAQQRKWEEDGLADAELKERDPEAYYAKYPYRRPTIETAAEKRKREERDARANAKWERAWARAQARGITQEEYDKRAQGRRAQSAGAASADKVNLQPFLKDGQATTKGKLQ